MKIEVISKPKSRLNRKAGDDVPVCIPGRLYGVFDGATDAFGARVNGESAGHIAARTVAEYFTAVAEDAQRAALPGTALMQQAARRLHEVNAGIGLRIPASTTAAVVLEQPDAFRILALGDSSIRINGERLYSRAKIIDEVSTAARVRAFRLLQGRLEGDDVEHAARQVIFLGFQQACEDGLLTRNEAERIVDDVCREARFSAISDHVRHFLVGGIQTQFMLANNAVSPLGYGALNGSQPLLHEIVEARLPKADVRTIELFTDGYFSTPADTNSAAWEAEFERVEREDYHKIGAHRGVKGSTADEFSDDRTVICLAFGDVS